MAHTNKNKDDIDWIDGLTQGLSHDIDEVPDGWLNARQIGRKINRSRQTAARSTSRPCAARNLKKETDVGTAIRIERAKSLPLAA